MRILLVSEIYASFSVIATHICGHVDTGSNAICVGTVYFRTHTLVILDLWVLGAIKSDAGVQGLPCDGANKQGKPCTPSVFSNAGRFVCITFNRTHGFYWVNRIPIHPALGAPGETKRSVSCPAPNARSALP